ncbi:hypothetical protein SAMN05192541_1297 [Bradyrhizobium arachidis]|nr:hypothetical protein SAMN05192541_1297 [Bradyrhizobium arachidis]
MVASFLVPRSERTITLRVGAVAVSGLASCGSDELAVELPSPAAAARLPFAFAFPFPFLPELPWLTPAVFSGSAAQAGRSIVAGVVGCNASSRMTSFAVTHAPSSISSSNCRGTSAPVPTCLRLATMPLSPDANSESRSMTPSRTARCSASSTAPSRCSTASHVETNAGKTSPTKVSSRRTRPLSSIRASRTSGSSVLARESIKSFARAIRVCRYTHLVLRAQPVCSLSAASSALRISGVLLGKWAVAAQTDCIRSRRNTFFPHHSMWAA